MTQVKDLVEKLGLKAEELGDDFAEKVASYKEEMDTETRRKSRIVWSVISAVCLVVGFFIGRLF